MVLMVSAGPGSGFQFDTHSVQHMSSVNKLQKRKPQRRGDRSQMPPRNLLHCWSLCSRSALHIYIYIHIQYIIINVLYIYLPYLPCYVGACSYMIRVCVSCTSIDFTCWTFCPSCRIFHGHSTERSHVPLLCYTPRSTTHQKHPLNITNCTMTRVWYILILLGSEIVEGLTCSDGIPSTTSALQPCSLAAPWRSSKTPTCLWRSRIAPNPGQLWGTGGFHRLPKGEHQSSKLLIIWQMMK